MKKFLSLVLALIMVMSLVTVGTSAAFADAEEIQYTEAVEVMSALGILKGSNGSFDPKGSITRQAAAKIIAYIALGVDEAEDLICIESPFADVAADATLAPYVAWAAKEGIINGVGDGTNFEPKSPVSGHAFLKMVLGALGIEGTYTGDGWRLNVTTAAAEAELFEGIDTTAIDLRANATRELASQIAFNAMFYSEDESEILYSVYTNVYEGDEHVNTIWHYEGSDAQSAAFAKIANEGSTMEQHSVFAGSFAWENFGLMSNPAYGEFSRPATLYSSVMDDDLAVYVYDTPVLTYENGVKEKTIWTDLGYTKATNTNITLNVRVDGADEASTMNYAKGDAINSSVAGNGAIVEVYKASGTRTYDVVVINTYVDVLEEDQIVEAEPATSKEDAVPAYIIVEGDELAYDEDGTFETDAFAEDDVILYTKDGAEIKTVVKAEKIENVKIAKYVAETSVTIGDKTYSYSAQAEDIEESMSFTQAYNYYLDAQGNIIYREDYSDGPAAVITDYAYITKVEAQAYNDGSSSLLDGATDAYAVAEVIFVDGSKEIVEIQVKKATSKLNANEETGDAEIAKNAYYYYLPNAEGVALRAVVADIGASNEAATINTWFAYEVNEDGTYTFSAIDEDYAKVSSADIAAKKNVALKVNNDKLTTSKTVYTYIDTEGVVTTSTGLVKVNMAVEGLNQILYTYAKNGTTVTAVYAVNQDELEEDAPDAVYAYAVEAGATVKDGTEWTFYIDGEEVTYVVDDEVEAPSEDTIYTVVIEDGIVTSAVEVESTTTKKLFSEQTVALVDDTFFNLGGNNVYYFTDDSVVYDIQDGVAVAELAEDDIITMIIKKNSDNLWELVIAYITDVAED